MSAILRITRGVHDQPENNESIDLINELTGLHVVNWTPNVASYKGDELLGTSVDSPISDFAESRFAVWNRIDESVTVNAAGFDQDHLASILSDLDIMLRDSSLFWRSEWSNEIVYLTVKSKDESNPRYAILYGGQITSSPDIYNQPFLQRDGSAVSGEFTVSLTRGHWMSAKPGETECIKVMRRNSFDNYREHVLNLPPRRSTGVSLTENLVAYWPMDETAGTSVVEEINSWTGEYQAGLGTITLDAERFVDNSPAPRFSGGGFPSAKLASSSTIPEPFPDIGDYWNDGLRDMGTVSLWMNLNATARADNGYVFYIGEEIIEPDEQALIVEYWTGPPAYFRIQRKQNNYIATSGFMPNIKVYVDDYIDDLDVDEWINLTIVWDAISPGTLGKRLKVYVNGILDQGDMTLSDLLAIEPFVGDENNVAVYVNSRYGPSASPAALDGAVYAHVMIFDIPLSNEEITYVINPSLFGEREDCFGDYVSSYYTRGNINYVYRYDASGPSYTDLSSQVVPFDLLPDPPAVGDILYIGSERYIFSSAVFNLANGSGVATVWEYWDGSAWSSLSSYTSNMGNLNSDGERLVVWDLPDDWAITAVNSVGAYWVRARVVQLRPFLATPQQVTDVIYTANKPYLDTQETLVGGDIPALGLLDASIVGPSNALKVIVGKRNLGRGRTFSAYLNAGGWNNPPGVAVSTLGTAASVVSSTGYPGHGYILFDPTIASTGYESIAKWTVGGAVTEEYYGLYRAIMLLEYNGIATGDLYARLAYNTRIGTTVAFPSVVPNPDDDGNYVDLGLFSMPPPGIDWVEILFQVYVTDPGTWNIRLITLHLIPADEWVAEIEVNRGAAGVSNRDRIILDSTTKSGLHGRTRAMIADYAAYPTGSGEIITDFGELSTTGPFEVTHNNQDRLWFFFHNMPIFDPQDNTFAKVKIEGVKRYLGLRGGG